MQPLRQSNWGGGELSPSLYGRSDLPQYGKGSRTLRNFLVSSRGTALNRPGTQFISQCKFSGTGQPPPRLIPFVLDSLDTYVLEVGNQYIRFYKNGQPIMVGAVPYEVATPWDGRDLSQLKVAQVGSVLYMLLGTGPVTGTNYTPQTLTFTGTIPAPAWTLAPISFDVPQPAFIVGGNQNPDGTTASLIGPQSVGPTTNVQESVVPQQWQWAITELGQTPDGRIFESAPVNVTYMQMLVKGGATPWDNAVTYPLGAVVFENLLGEYWTSLQNGNTNNTPSTSPAWWQHTPNSPPPPFTPKTLSVPNSQGQIGAISLETFAAPTGAQFWFDTQTYTKGQYVILDGQPSGRWWVATQNVPAGKCPLAYGTLVEDPTSANFGQPNTNTVYWDGPHGPAFLSWQNYSGVVPNPGWRKLGNYVYRGLNGSYGRLGFTTTNSFQDYGQTPDLTNPPPQGRNPFKVFGPGGNLIRTETPSVIGFHQGRMVLADTQFRPMWLWGSQIANFTNFDNHIPGQTADEYEFQLASQQYEQLRGMLSIGANIFFTSAGGLWVVSGDGGAISRSNIEGNRNSKVGGSWVDPIALTNAGLYVRDLGVGVNEILFDWRLTQWRTNDVTSLSRHLFDGHSVIDWAYAQEPFSTVWAVREDGVLLSLVYQAEDAPQNEQPLPEIKCWAWHDTGPQVGTPPTVANGQVKQTRDSVQAICSVRESSTPSGQSGNLPPEDAVYVVVSRNNPSFGLPQQYIERFYTRQLSLPVPATGAGQLWPFVFLDCAFIFSPVVAQGGTGGVIGGLLPLQGETVYALADGQVIGPYLVSAGGSIDISDQFPNQGPDLGDLPAVLVVGLPYFPDWSSLDAASAQLEVRGKRKSVAAAFVEVVTSRGFWTGPDFKSLVEWQQKQTSDGFNTIGLFTGQVPIYVKGSYDFSGRCCLRQVDPLPIEMVGFSRELDVGGEL